jgi:hypothetical protein
MSIVRIFDNTDDKTPNIKVQLSNATGQMIEASVDNFILRKQALDEQRGTTPHTRIGKKELIIGRCGEDAVASLANVYEDYTAYYGNDDYKDLCFSVRGFKDTICQVRTRTSNFGNLIFELNEPLKAHIYILCQTDEIVIDKNGKYYLPDPLDVKIVGWCYKEDVLKHRKPVRLYNKDKYEVERENLRNIRELIELLKIDITRRLP